MREPYHVGAVLPPAGNYSQLRTRNGLAKIAGQVGIDPATREFGQSREAQARFALQHFVNVLTAHGLETGDVISLGVYATDPEAAAAVDLLIPTFFPEPYPTRKSIYVGLPAGLFVEIDGTAVGEFAGRRPRSGADMGSEHPVTVATTPTFGRFDVAATEHFIADASPKLGGPGAHADARDLFLASLGVCASGTIQRIAREWGLSIGGVIASVADQMDDGQPASIVGFTIEIAIYGVGDADANRLTTEFSKRCPLYRMVSLAAPISLVTKAS